MNCLYNVILGMLLVVITYSLYNTMFLTSNENKENPYY
jgi:hypothetical protein